MGNPRHTALMLLLLGLAAVAATASAQENLGLLVGFERTTLVGDEPENFKYRQEPGYTVAAVVEFSLTDDILLSVRPGFRRVATGIAYKDRRAGVVRDSLRLEIDWLVLPVLAKISGGETIFATGGLDVAFALGGGLEGGEKSEPHADFVGDVDLAALVGVGLELSVGRHLVICELRYRQGLLNVADVANPDNEALPARFRFSGLQLQVGLLVPLGGS